MYSHLLLALFKSLTKSSFEQIPFEAADITNSNCPVVQHSELLDKLGKAVTAGGGRGRAVLPALHISS